MGETMRIVAMAGSEWDRLRAILAKHPDVQAELNAAGLSVVTFDAPLTDDYVNSDGKVVASHPVSDIRFPLAWITQPDTAEPDASEAIAP